MRRAGKKARRAFTLVEIVVAMGISAFVMVGACVIMFNTSSIVAHFEKSEPFDLHVNGVENFLRYCLINAEFPSDMETGLTGAGTTQTTDTILWGYPPDTFLNDKRKLCFGVMDDRPFFISRRGFSPEKIAWLDFREKGGLFLIWRFVKNENYYEHDEIPVYESLVSEFVTAVEYVYIDSTGTWSFETDPETLPSGVSQGTLPNFKRLTFQYGPEVHERIVSLSPVMDQLFKPSSSGGSSSGSSGTRNGGGSNSGRGGGQ